MPALVRIGLVVMLVVAPALCCCQARWLLASAAPVAVAAAEAPPACPHCCRTEVPPAPEAPAPKPQPTNPHCMFCDGQGTAIVADPLPQVGRPDFTGERLPAFLTPVAPVHPAFGLGLYLPERVGVDARSAALFDRHVMRC